MPREPITAAKALKTLEDNGIALSKKQFEMIIHYLRGMNKSDACEAAGLLPTSVWSLFGSAKVQAAMTAIMDRFLVNDAAPAALRCLYTIVQDERAAPGVRVTAANSLLDRSGFDTKRHSIQATGDNDPASMTADELRAEIDRLEREQEARMSDITPDDSEKYSYLSDLM